jgi:hypothetical protein
MRSFTFRVLMVLACLVVLAAGAMADVPSNLIVTRGSLEWVWAAPCAPVQPSCGNTLTLPQYGFDIPTNAEWLASFTDRADLYNAFTNPNQLCASVYFNSGYSHCDSGDLQNGAIWHSPFCDPNYFDGCNNPASETLLVRGGTIPEPNSLALIGTGLLGCIGVIRRKLYL